MIIHHLSLRRAARNAGAMYIDTVISVFVIMVFLAFAMAFLPIFMQKYQLDMAAEDLAREISVSGSITAQDADELSAEYGIVIDNVEITPAEGVVTKDVGNEKHIQLADSFTVTLYSHREIGVGGIVSAASVSISSTAKGRSEVYWKEMAEEATAP